MSQTRTFRKLSEFDLVIKQINNAGVFQKRFALVFVSGLTLLAGMQYMSKVISLTVPNHWCHVPGREKTNYTVEEWKNITIPMEINSNGILDFTKCTRFANETNAIIKCDNGWEYDRTWYDLTVSMQNDWVCDKHMIPTNLLAIYRVAEVIGTILFGHIADNYGRRPTFFITIGTVLLGRLTTLFTSSYLYVFCFFSFIGSLPSSSLFHSPYVIGMEISEAENRAFVSMVLGCGWAIGVTISPLFMWWQRNWINFCLITILPTAFFLFTKTCIIESPRWLASRGKNKRCIKVLNRIAETNQTQIPKNILARLIKANTEEPNIRVYTVFSLLSSKRLTKNITILIYSTSSAIFIYMCLVISADSLSGNPYVNYLFLGLVDIPVYCFNKYFCDRFGRRFMGFFSLLIMSLGCLTMAIVVKDPTKSVVMTVAFILTKGSASMVFGVLNLQAIEICPTCIRQTGISVVAIIANSFCILGPYVVALGVTTNLLIPNIIYVTCALLALVCCLFLPETLNHQLPDTLEEAALFGANQDFWGRTKIQKIFN